MGTECSRRRDAGVDDIHQVYRRNQAFQKARWAMASTTIGEGDEQRGGLTQETMVDEAAEARCGSHGNYRIAKIWDRRHPARVATRLGLSGFVFAQRQWPLSIGRLAVTSSALCIVQG